MTTQEQPRFADVTTLHVGGSIADLQQPGSHEEFVELLHTLHAHNKPYLVLGGGSNVVASDDPYQGTVIIPHAAREPEVWRLDERRVRVIAPAGFVWDDLVAFCVAQGFAGLEALSGIPGSAGAAPIQNIGAYGYEVAQLIDRVEVFDRTTAKLSWRPYASFKPTYRKTTLKTDRSRFVVTRISVVLQASTQSLPIAYAQLANCLQVQPGDCIDVKQVRAAVLELRSNKGMVYDENDHDTWSCGSFFTNPIVAREISDQIPQEIVRYDQADSSLVKLSAAALIEHAGCAKGFCLPQSAEIASLSTKHVLAITNRGQATAQDIVNLAFEVQRRVQDVFGVLLVSEPVGIGIKLP